MEASVVVSFDVHVSSFLQLVWPNMLVLELSDRDICPPGELFKPTELLSWLILATAVKVAHTPLCLRKRTQLNQCSRFCGLQNDLQKINFLFIFIFKLCLFYLSVERILRFHCRI